MNPYEQMLASIKGLGRDIRYAEYRFDSTAQGQEAAGVVVDNMPAVVSLARAGKVKIGTVKFADGIVLVIGGLLSEEQLAAAHRIIIRSGGKFSQAALPPGSGITLSQSGVEDLRAERKPSSTGDTYQPGSNTRNGFWKNLFITLFKTSANEADFSASRSQSVPKAAPSSVGVRQPVQVEQQSAAVVTSDDTVEDRNAASGVLPFFRPTVATSDNSARIGTSDEREDAFDLASKVAGGWPAELDRAQLLAVDFEALIKRLRRYQQMPHPGSLSDRHPEYRLVSGQVARAGTPIEDFKIATVASMLAGKARITPFDGAASQFAYQVIQEYGGWRLAKFLFSIPRCFDMAVNAQAGPQTIVINDFIVDVYSGIENVLFEIYEELGEGEIMDDGRVRRKLLAIASAR